MPWSLLCLTLLACIPATASAWTLSEAHLGFRATAEGETFDARFDDFTIRPSMDGRLPLAFDVEVVLDSVDSGYPDRDTEMRGPDWFDSAARPLARFRSTSIELLAEGGFVAHGELMLKGVGRVLAVPFDWDASIDRLSMRGGVEVDRRWFGVGPAEDDAVAATVTVSFAFVWVPADG